jgi:hypothetical protein
MEEPCEPISITRAWENFSGDNPTNVRALIFAFRRDDQMDIEIAILVAGVLIMVGGIVGGGAIYAGLEKPAEAIKKQK